jgi:hypothetical protein
LLAVAGSCAVTASVAAAVIATAAPVLLLTRILL